LVFGTEYKLKFIPKNSRLAYFVLFLLIFTSSLFAQDHSTTLVIPPRSHAPIHKATGTHLFFAVGRRTTVDNPQGVALTKLNSQDDPDTENDDDELTVYGVNAGHNEIIYNTSLIDIEIYRPKENDDDALLRPRGITANPKGLVYVADTGHRRVLELFNSKQGKQLVFRQSGRSDDSTFVPFDVSLTQDGSLFVSDSAGGKIWRWYPIQNRWDLVVDSVETPLGIAAYDQTDRWTAYRPSQIAFIAKDGREVWITDFSGKLIAKYQPDDNNSKFRYIAVDYFNNFYVTDEANNRVVKIDRYERFVDSIGQKGKGDYQFMSPQGIAIWKRFGQVCVAESRAADYFFIGTDIKNPILSVNHNTLRFQFFLTEQARVTIWIDSLHSAMSDTVIDRQVVAQGDRSIPWQIPDNWQPGKYLVHITATPYYSSTKYFTASKQLNWNYLSQSSALQSDEE